MMSFSNLGNDSGFDNKKSTNMIDVTELFKEACSKELSASKPLIHNEAFNLFESMSALELTDRKMDACEVPASHYTSSSCSTGKTETTATVPPRPMPSQLEALPWTNLKFQDTKDIAWQLCNNFYAFLNGTSLAESVFTCLYLHQHILEQMTVAIASDIQKYATFEASTGDRDAIDQIIDIETMNTSTCTSETKLARILLGLICHLVIFNSKLIRKIISHADIYQEEDFNLSTHSLLPTDRTNFHILSIQDITSCFQSISTSSKFIQTHTHDNNNNHLHISIILKIIQFFIDFHNINQTLSSQLHYDNANVHQLVQNMKSFIESSTLPNLQRLIDIKAQENLDLDSQQQNKKILFETFDPYINRHLLGNAPVRNISTFYFTDTNHTMHSIQSLFYITQELATAVCTLLLDGNDLNKICCILQCLTCRTTTCKTTNTSSSSSSTTTTKADTATHSSNVNILSRSLLIINLYFNDLLFGQHILPSTISQSMINYYNVPSALLYHTEYGNQFCNRLGKPIYDVFKVYLLNKSRQREFISQVLFQEWNGLVNEAAIVDHCFHRDYLSTDNGSDDNNNNHGSGNMSFVTNYILYMIVELMERYIYIGMEIGLFNGSWHLLTGYWYLSFLNSTRLNLLTGMRDCMKARKAMEQRLMKEERESQLQQQQKQQEEENRDKCNNNGKGKKKGKKGKKIQTKTLSSTGTDQDEENSLSTEKAVEDGLDLLILKMKQFMFKGIVRVS